ncbi:hypothetical protein Ccar_05820 [Clostridium carboxidivorans P7]|uniref:Uncharacterized protein n=1 Tax=Clostridium carboxidivorans P7 TaxID=536227 RepID=C6PPM1_9CLOT|nr:MULTISPECIES: hypothetical protein [Clostridium]AKN30364.1 hypothetical protein Ccar_05820 [Clostridium carboxidivorans P7]EET88751.1 conserved hypothetical protein [Clostridium carboxidivorans P7]WPC44338.1 hypothetical protein Q6H37_12905 [Clostridium sp. JS66]
MKIYIKSGKMGFTIPVPNVLLKFGISIVDAPFIQKHISEKDKKYVNMINWKELSSSIDILREYKGLKIVDVHSKDGSHVTITL